MISKIKYIAEKFGEIARLSDSLNLKGEDGQLSWVDVADNPRPVAHDSAVFVSDSSNLKKGKDGRLRWVDVDDNPRGVWSDSDDDSGVFGRENDKAKVFNLLSSDVCCKFSVIPILGVGGLGKTTLARLVYNDPRVVQFFDYKVWVRVWDDFDVKEIARKIIRSITGKGCDLKELYAIQATLEEKVEGKNVFLVLDDIQNVNQNSWGSFKATFVNAAVKILVTTRNDSVAGIIQTVPSYGLDYLTEDQCWLLFRRHAFGGGDPEGQPNLVEAGLQIVKRCGGLPLAVRILGALLAYEKDENRWRDILQSDLWDSASHINEVSPALEVSYHFMPAPLQPCFLYASMFPKNHVFKKYRLVNMWLAQGYIRPRAGKRLEEIGRGYFEELHRRSFFLKGTSKVNGVEHFLMDDMFHDLARSVSTDECFTLTSKDDVETCIFSDQVRHFHAEELQKEVSLASLPLRNPRSLRTLSILYGKENDMTANYDHQLETFGCLRSLLLHCRNFPASASNLKHLRFLELRSSSNVRLPESICHLYNLHTLNLSYCTHGVLIPRGIENLISLRHLYLPQKSCIPLGIGKLTNLQKVHGFNVGGSRTYCGQLGELKDLTDLRRELKIGGLKSVVNIEDAKEANLRSKQKIETLTLVWNVECCENVNFDFGNTSNNTGDAAENEQCEDDDKSKKLGIVVRSDDREKGIFDDEDLAEALLESLCPHANLIKLRIISYDGVRFPSWMGEPSFSKLTAIQLSGCNCNVLPPLGQLPSLKFLEIQRMHYLKCVARELCCSTTAVTKVVFPSLEVLKMISLMNWEEWYGVMDADFPCLCELYIDKCYKLRSLPTITLLQSLYINYNNRLVSLYFNQKRGSILKTVNIIGCSRLALLVGLHELDCLEELKIKNCPELQFTPEEKWPLKLQTLHISACSNLSSVMLLKNLTSLRILKLTRCRQLYLLPDDHLPSNLQTLILSDCWKLTSLVGLQNLASLKKLKLRRCYHLQIFPDNRLSSVPEYVDIIDCPGMMGWCQRHELTYNQELSTHNELTVSDLNEVKNLPSVEYLCLKNITSIPRDINKWLPSTLRTLEICFSYGLGSLFLDQNLSSLEKLIIRGCTNLTNVVGIHNLPSLQRLAICNCPQLELTKDQCLPSSLQSLVLHGCDKLGFLQLLDQDLSALKELQIWNCHMLKIVTGLKNLTSLQSLTVKQCPLLELSPDEQLYSNPEHVEIEDCPGLRKWCQGNKIPCNQVFSSIIDEAGI